MSDDYRPYFQYATMWVIDLIMRLAKERKMSQDETAELLSIYLEGIQILDAQTSASVDNTDVKI